MNRDHEKWDVTSPAQRKAADIRQRKRYIWPAVRWLLLLAAAIGALFWGWWKMKGYWP